MSDVLKLAQRLELMFREFPHATEHRLKRHEAETAAAAMRRVARLEEALRDLLHYSDEAGGARNSEEAAVRCAAREALK